MADDCQLRDSVPLARFEEPCRKPEDR